MVSVRRPCLRAIACGHRETSLAPRRAFGRSRELGLFQLTSARLLPGSVRMLRPCDIGHPPALGFAQLCSLTPSTPVRGKLSCAGTARVMPHIAAGRLMLRAHGPRRDGR